VVVIGAAETLRYKERAGKELSSSAATQAMLMSSLFCLCVYCILNTKDSVHVRPHPAVWRVTHAVALFYLIILSAMAVAPLQLGHRLVDLTFPELKVERSAAPEAITDEHLQCELTMEVLYRQLSSVWFTAHVLGWCGKMCVFRSWRICLVYSFLFEMIELSLQWLIPEFQECWWDSVILDFLISNMLGMVLGYFILRLLNQLDYDHLWSKGEIEGVEMTFFSRMLVQFTPLEIQNYEWNTNHSMAHWFFAHFMIVVPLMLETNSFFIMQAFHIPQNHPFHVVRQLFFMLIPAIQGIAEAYAYNSGRSVRWGHAMWTMALVTILETYVVIRYWAVALDFNDLPTPGLGVTVPWGSFLILKGTWLVFFFYVYQVPTKLQPNDLPMWLKVLDYGSILPLFALSRYWAF